MSAVHLPPQPAPAHRDAADQGRPPALRVFRRPGIRKKHAACTRHPTRSPSQGKQVSRRSSTCHPRKSPADKCTPQRRAGQVRARPLDGDKHSPLPGSRHASCEIATRPCLISNSTDPNPCPI
jgi:hypothetical protein